jgi:hypothetical protein
MRDKVTFDLYATAGMKRPRRLNNAKTRKSRVQGTAVFDARGQGLGRHGCAVENIMHRNINVAMGMHLLRNGASNWVPKRST